MSLNPDVDVAKLLYYNPELTAYSNIVSNQEASDWLLTNSVDNLRFNDEAIPVGFNAEVFIADFKNVVDASSLNETIRQAMLKEGFTNSDLNNRARYVTSIYQDAKVVESNILKFNYLSQPTEKKYYIDNNKLRVGDSIKLIDTSTLIHEYATIKQIIDNQTIEISNIRKIYDNLGAVYTIVGIKVYDYIRLAKINFVRGLDPYPQVPNVDALTYIDPTFNPELYRLLYPDTKHLSDAHAYQDYINRKDNNVRRVGRVEDIPLDSNIFEPSFDYLNVNYRLILDSLCTVQWGDKYVYGFSQDDTSHSRLINKNQDRIITEWAIKKYVDRNFDEQATFNNVTISGDATFNGTSVFNNSVTFQHPITINNNLLVGGRLEVQQNTSLLGSFEVQSSSTFYGGTNILGPGPNYIEDVNIKNANYTGSQIFDTDAYMQKNMYHTGYTLGPRIGIGPAIGVSNISEPDGLYDAKLKNIDVREYTTIGSDLPPNRIALRVNGYVEADNITNISDSRLKYVKGLYTNALDPIEIIQALDPKVFCYKNNPSKTKLGFMADEVAQVVPEAVNVLDNYETDVSFSIHTNEDNTRILLHQKDEGTFQVDDELRIENKWYRVIRIVSPLCIELDNPIKSTGRLKVERIRLYNVKTLDYQCLTAALWSAVKSLSNRNAA